MGKRLNAPSLATQSTLSDEELTDIKDHLYREQGIDAGSPTFAPVALSKEDFGGGDTDLPKTVVCSLEEVENANHLATGQVLPFAVEGLTILYGDNGSGKTGYARLLKALCRARRDQPEPILGNVYDPKQKQPASVKVTYHSEGANHSVTWKYGTPPPGEMCRISVFDSSTAPLYANRQNQLEFLPKGLDVIPRLGNALARLAAAIDQDSISTKQSLALSLPIAPAGSGAANLFAQLAIDDTSPLPTIAEVQSLGDWDDDDTEHLIELETKIKALEEPAKAVARYQRASAAINRIRVQVAAVDEVFRASTPTIIEQLREGLAAAQSAAAIAAQEQFNSDPLGKYIGTNPWRKLYEHARDFSKVAYPDQEFPVTDEGSFCVLCQQPLDAAAGNRLARFRNFMENVTRREVVKLEQEIDQIRSALGKARLSSQQDMEALLGEFGELSPEYETLQAMILDYYENAHSLVAHLQKILDGPVPDLPPSVPPSICALLDETVASLGQRTVELKLATANGADIENARKERSELLGRKLVHVNLPALLDRLSALNPPCQHR